VSTRDAIWDQLADVLKSYRRLLVEEGKKLRALLDSIDQDPQARRQLKQFAHRLAGTAGSYELRDIARAARALEDYLDADGDPRPAAEELARCIAKEAQP
jgi:HPt (histidine-containing phosphotransfer) domain-containing protein